jgi:hypothetical protein
MAGSLQRAGRGPRTFGCVLPWLGLAMGLGLGGCKFEPLGWWDIVSLRAEVEGQEPVEVEDVGFVQISDDGGDYAQVLTRYLLIPQLDGRVVPEPKPEVDADSASWELEGAQGFALSMPMGETMVGLSTDDTKGDRLSLSTEEPALFYVPSTWTGEGAGSGASVTVNVSVELQR